MVIRLIAPAMEEPSPNPNIIAAAASRGCCSRSSCQYWTLSGYSKPSSLSAISLDFSVMVRLAELLQIAPAIANPAPIPVSTATGSRRNPTASVMPTVTAPAAAESTAEPSIPIE